MNLGKTNITLQKTHPKPGRLVFTNRKRGWGVICILIKLVSKRLLLTMQLKLHVNIETFNRDFLRIKTLIL